MPYIGKSQDGTTINLLDVEGQNIREIKERFGGASCPACGGKFLLVVGRIKRTHFRHEVKCPYEHEPESETHLAMKAYFKKIFPFAELEVPMENTIVDVLLREMKVAIECQVSDISPDEIKRRTRIHNRHGFYTLWVLGNRYLGPARSSEIIARNYERFLHGMYFGRVYYYTYAGVCPFHFERVQSTRTTVDGDEYLITLKRRKVAEPGEVIRGMRLCKADTTPNRLKGTDIETFGIARFYDRRFW